VGVPYLRAGHPHPAPDRDTENRMATTPGGPGSQHEPDVDELDDAEFKKRSSLLRRRRAESRARKSSGRPLRSAGTGPITAFREEPTLESLARKVDLLTAIVLAPAAGSSGTVASDPTIWSHGGRSYSCDGEAPVCVTCEVHCVLKLFLDQNRSLTRPEIERCSVETITRWRRGA
jgi:hypothetical protein